MAGRRGVGQRVFFREAAKTYESFEGYMNPVDDKATAEILQLCREIRHGIDENDGHDLASMLVDLGRRLGKVAD